MLDANRRFHALPTAAKEAVAINAAHRGYMGFASSLIVTSSVERARKPNQSESFMMMHELAPDDPELLAGRPLQGPNRWPEHLPGFRAAVVAYNDTLAALGRRLMGAISLALGCRRIGRPLRESRPPSCACCTTRRRPKIPLSRACSARRPTRTTAF